MVRDVKSNPYTDDHYCIHGSGESGEFRDDFDDDVNTAHLAVRYRDNIVASIRIVDGKNQVSLTQSPLALRETSLMATENMATSTT